MCSATTLRIPTGCFSTHEPRTKRHSADHNPSLPRRRAQAHAARLERLPAGGCFRSQAIQDATFWRRISISVKNACSASTASTGNREVLSIQKGAKEPFINKVFSLGALRSLRSLRLKMLVMGVGRFNRRERRERREKSPHRGRLQHSHGYGKGNPSKLVPRLSRGLSRPCRGTGLVLFLQPLGRGRGLAVLRGRRGRRPSPCP